MALDIVLWRPSWQKLRVSCLQVNNPYGGMNTVVGADDAINRMNNYINDAIDGAIPQYTQDEISSMGVTSAMEYAARIYRVSAFLQATVNGLVSQPGMIHMNKVRQYFSQVQAKADNSSVTQYASKWSWDVVNEELRTMFQAENFWFMAICRDMQERIKEKHNNSEDLRTFMSMLETLIRQ